MDFKGNYNVTDNNLELQKNSGMMAYFKETSLYGFPRIVKAENRCLKVFWLIWLVLCLAFTIFTIINQVQNYLNYEMEFTSHYESREHSQLPAVTLCDLSWNINHQSNVMNMSVMNYSHYISILHEHKSHVESLGESRLNNILQQNWHYLIREGFAESIGYEEVKKITKPFDEFILSCELHMENAHVPCDMYMEISHNLLDFTYPQCFTLSIKENGDDEAALENIENLIATLHIGSHVEPLYSSNEADDMIDQTRGKILFHDKNILPDVKYSGHYINPGRAYWFHIEQETRKRLASPYGNCDETSGNSGKRQWRHYIYSERNCMMQCKQEEVENECFCLDRRYVVSSTDLNYCGYLNQMNFSQTLHNVACYRNVVGDMTKNCKCAISCEETLFQPKYMFSEWPAGFGKLGLYNSMIMGSVYEEYFQNEFDVIKHQIDVGNTSEAMQLLHHEESINEHFLKLNINFNNLKRVLITEQKVKTTVSDLLRNITLDFYFWCGITAYTFAELLALIISSLCKLRARNK